MLGIWYKSGQGRKTRTKKLNVLCVMMVRVQECSQVLARTFLLVLLLRRVVIIAVFVHVEGTQLLNHPEGGRALARLCPRVNKMYN